MKYVAIFHANLNYAYLEPKKYETVIRGCYELIIDTFREKFPQQRYVFEGSGFTIDVMAEKCPDVLQKLKNAVAAGQCEFMGAPYAHPIMANIPAEAGKWSLEFAMRAYDKHLGFRPESAWNPECTWMQRVPYIFRDAGFKYMTLDFESYMCSVDKEYGWVERPRPRDMNWGGNLPYYDLDPNHPALHKPFREIVPGLSGFTRSDRLIGGYIRYFRNQCTLEQYIQRIKKWSGSKDEGALVIVADDAEYTGTTGYYFVKYYQDYSRSFSVDPEGAAKLEALVAEVGKLGQMITFKEACEMEHYDEPYYVDDRCAWHRAYADAWGGTPEATFWDPMIHDMLRDYKNQVEPKIADCPEFKETTDKFWFHLTNSYNSDGRWPPPPALTCPFNREWVEKEIQATRELLAELKEKTADMPMPEKEEEKKVFASTAYGYFYTEKDPDDVRHLNLYELSHALYAAYKLYDHGEDKEPGKEKIRKIFEEFKRRGFNNMVVPPAIAEGDVIDVR